MRTRVPERISEPVVRLCARVCPRSEPRFVPVLPDPASLAHECFGNVADKVRRQGGRLVHGWAIWEWPGVLVEGEFHAVWADPAGRLVDIAPRSLAMRSILFLPDPQRRYQGRLVNNVRQPLSADPLVREYVQLMDDLFELKIAEAADRQAATVASAATARRKTLLIVRRMTELETHLGIRAVRAFAAWGR